MKQLIAKLLPSFLRYILLGGIVFAIDLGSFKLFMMSGLYRPLAVTLAYALGVVFHFTLNRFFNFKNFEHSAVHQFSVYLIVVSFCWLLTVFIIEIGVQWFGLTAMVGKMIAIAINVPVGFLGHRYITFGSGAKAFLRNWQRLWLKRP